jgi:hypothetical protein
MVEHKTDNLEAIGSSPIMPNPCFAAFASPQSGERATLLLSSPRCGEQYYVPVGGASPLFQITSLLRNAERWFLLALRGDLLAKQAGTC